MRQKVKKTSIRKKVQKGSIGTVFVYAILILLIAAGFVSIGGLPNIIPSYKGKVVSIITPTPAASRNTLQMQTFGYSTITPKPKISPGNQATCAGAEDKGIAVTGCTCLGPAVVCKNGKAYNINGAPFDFGYKNSINLSPDFPCGTVLAPGNGTYCIGKPVIYLYPTKQTVVSVAVKTPGRIVISNPTYPTGSWQNILAEPDGTFTYNGHQYSELFYESLIHTFQKPAQGIIIPTSKLSIRLAAILDRLGLIAHEKQEFLGFWLPKLQQLHAPYIQFSILTANAKNQIDAVTITPKPDTQIAFIAYFKPVFTRYNLPELQLPPKPHRKGFVSVEWGGILDR